MREAGSEVPAAYLQHYLDEMREKIRDKSIFGMSKVRDQFNLSQLEYYRVCTLILVNAIRMYSSIKQ